MGDFQGILDALWGRPAPPAMVEHGLDRALCEQLIWRRGEHLWQDEATALMNLADGCRLSSFGSVTACLSRAEEEQGFPALDELADVLPLDMGVIGGLAEGPAQRMAAGQTPEQVLRDFPKAVGKLSEKSGAVFIQDDLSVLADSGLGAQALLCLKAACEAAHRKGRPVIWVDLSHCPLPLEKVAQLPFNAVQLSDRYPFATKDAIRYYGQRFSLLGRTDFAQLMALKPVDIIADFTSLWSLSQGKGYLFGSGNIDGRPIPYLTFLSMLTAIRRL